VPPSLPAACPDSTPGSKARFQASSDTGEITGRNRPAERRNLTAARAASASSANRASGPQRYEPPPIRCVAALLLSKLNLEFAMVGFDAAGKRVNYLGRSVALQLDPAHYAQIMANGIRVRMALDLPSGEGFLRIAVQDLAAGRAGSLEIPVTEAAK